MTTDQRAGLAMIIATMVVAIAMSFHPSGRDVLANAASGGHNVPDKIVHLVAIGGEIVLLIGTLALTSRLSAHRELAVSAFVVFAVAMMALIVAAVASGLIAPSLAERIASADDASRDTLRAMFNFNGQLNQAFAILGFSLFSVAILLWSVALVSGRFARSLGIYGMISSVVVLLVLATGQRFVLHGAGGLIMASQMVWTIWVGLRMRKTG